MYIAVVAISLSSPSSPLFIAFAERLKPTLPPTKLTVHREQNMPGTSRLQHRLYGKEITYLVYVSLQRTPSVSQMNGGALYDGIRTFDSSSAGLEPSIPPPDEAFHKDKQQGICTTKDLPALLRCCGLVPSKKMLSLYQEEIDDAGGLMSFGTFLDYCYRCRDLASEVTPEDLLGFCRSLEREGKEEGTLPVKVLRNLLMNVGEPFSSAELDSFLRDFADSEGDSVDYKKFFHTMSTAKAIPVTRDSDRK
ncbi:hypothetical protein FOZ63_003591 [Perkinsus olseni]|uniref:Uncharacterized protein n=1 Tax=Perkinsus olseni TaxID=32597 RepID=A0A7J6RHH1_PEROL|nr:hypothetical protein FOZ63_003591 [Perkinsus olseni]